MEAVARNPVCRRFHLKSMGHKTRLHSQMHSFRRIYSKLLHCMLHALVRLLPSLDSGLA